MRNAAGRYVEPSAQATTAAIDAYKDSLAKDVRIPIVDPPTSAKEAYPIASFTWLLVPATFQNQAKKQVMIGFLKWMLTDGQNFSKLNPDYSQYLGTDLLCNLLDTLFEDIRDIS